ECGFECKCGRLFRSAIREASPFGLSQFTPSMIREEDKIVEIRNKAAYARPAASPDTSRWAKEPSCLFDC
ncbi:MAG: hypothetical protein MJK14_04525, partial [Rivularia sp. ALOHA_DT_140]|nr:hypothetical protein [Rivularia sp. ALOHA_DT_140]